MSETAQDIIDDSMPEVPMDTGGAPVKEEIDGTFDADMLEGVGKMGDTIPNGTYHFRLHGAYEGWTQPKESAPGVFEKPAEAVFGAQPWFSLDWRCQQEPHTGRRVSEFVNWCSPKLFKAAKEGDPTAKQMVKNRLKSINDLFAAAGYKAVGQSNVKEFFASNPEVKINLKTVEKKLKDSHGKYTIPSGEYDNGVVKHISLTRPA